MINSIHQLFEAQVARRPEATAVECDGCILTYRELNHRANQLAWQLQRMGVGPEILVGVCVQRNLEMVLGLLAILKSGGAYVPLDPGSPPSRLALMLQDVEITVLLTESHFLPRLPEFPGTVLALDTEWATITQTPVTNLPNNITTNHLAYVIYTSGSTGMPKGITIPHHAVTRLVMNTNYIELGASDRVAQTSSISFDAATFEIWGALLNGAELVIIPKTIALSPPDFAAHLEQHAITTMFLTTVLFNQMARETPGAFQSVQSLLFGGEAVDPRWVREVLRTGPPQRLLHVYGPTESTTFTTWHLTEEVAPADVTVPIGRPIANTTVYILDQHMQPVTIGAPGELYIGGDGLARDYVNQPALTVEKFVPHPFSAEPGARLYRTGDLVRNRPDGTIEFLGRTDDQVKVRGFRIELGEIEASLRLHPSICEGAAILREDVPGDKRLVAYVILAGQAALSTTELHHFLGQMLPDYMVPSSFVILDAFPLTPNGKIDRRMLPAPVLARPALETNFIPPETPIEKMLAAIWSEVLRIEDLGIHDNFFELGGHSILAMQVITRVREAFQIEVPIRLFFDTPTMAAISHFIDEKKRASTQIPLLPILSIGRRQSGEFPSSYSQQRLWFLDQLEPGNPAYNVPWAFRLKGRLHVTALERSLNTIIARHEMLRTVFHLKESQLVQVIAPTQPLKISISDLRTLHEIQKETKAKQLVKDETLKPFDLANGPLFRAALIHLRDGEHIFLLVIHQIVTDMWSMGVIFREISLCYEDPSNKVYSTLPSLPIQYADFAYWQRQTLQGEAYQQLLSYWKHQLDGVPTNLTLPTDRQRPSVQTYQGDFQPLKCSLSLTNELKGLGQQEGATLFMTLLAAFMALLHRWSGQTDILIGSPVATRDVTEVEELIGFFINEVVLRGDLSGNPSFRDLLCRVRNMVLDAYTHRALPFQKLIENLQLPRDSSRALLFQVSFVLQNAPRGFLNLPGITADEFPLDLHTSQLDFGLEMEESSEGLVGSLTYNTDLFEATTIKRKAAEFTRILHDVTQNPDLKLSDISHLPSHGDNLEDSYPLSPIQEGMVYESLSARESGVNIQQLVVNLPEPLNVPAFKSAWQRVVHRHPALRTSFRLEDLDCLWQDVHRHVQFAWDERDWRTILLDSQTARLREFLQADRRLGFDLATAPLLRASLFRLTDARYQFIWTFHHAILDGRSLPIVLKEVFYWYEAICQNKELTLPSSRPFRDFIAWLSQQNLSSAETYWKKTLRDFRKPTPLVVDKKSEKTEGATVEHGEQEISLSAALTAQIEALSRQQGFTLNTVIQAAWALLLSRYSGEVDVLFGAVKGGRWGTVPEAESIVGICMNTLPIRIRVQNELSVLRWLKALRHERLIRRDYEQTPLMKSREWSELPHETSLFESLLVVEPHPWDAILQNHGICSKHRTFRLLERTSYPLTLVVYSGSEHRIVIEYDQNRFEDRTITRMLGHLTTLIEDMITDPDQQVWEIDLLTSAEQQYLANSRTIREDFASEGCLRELFEAQVGRTPEAVAVQDEIQHLTFNALNSRANQLAQQLQSLGGGPEVLIGMCVERSVELSVGILGILKTGGAYVALDPTYPQERLAHIICESALTILLTQEHLKSLCQALHAKAFPSLEANLEVISLDRLAPEVPLTSSLISSRDAGPHNLAYVMYTSGSTGSPKGVMVSRQAVQTHNASIGEKYDLRPWDRVLQFSAINFDVAVEELLASLHRGATVVHWPSQDVRDLADFMKFIRQHNLTVLNLPVSFWHEWLLEEARVGQVLPASLRLIVVGSETVRPDQWTTWQTQAGPRLRCCNAYGTTETAITTTVYDTNLDGPVLASKSIPIGRPLPNMHVYILDDRLRSVPIGVPGELHIGGGGLARGYLNLPDLTAQRFEPHPWSQTPGARLYKTGDLACWLSDGTIQFLGRLDNQIKIRGYRIELEEIESAINLYLKIENAVVLCRKDRVEDPQLVAYLPQDLELLNISALRVHLKEELPSYMVPVSYVLMEQLPLTPSGKVDRNALPKPTSTDHVYDHTYVAPRTPLEKVWVEIWQEVLGVDRVGVHDNFFSLGGHSILATRIVARFQSVTEHELPLRWLFEHPTIAQLCTHMHS